MGTNIRVEGRAPTVIGKANPSVADVRCSDLRASARSSDAKIVRVISVPALQFEESLARGSDPYLTLETRRGNIPLTQRLLSYASKSLVKGMAYVSGTSLAGARFNNWIASIPSQFASS